MTILLSIQNISKWFGGFAALSEVSIDVGTGERHAVIGPNGAGKSTLFNVINGQLKPSSGRIVMSSEDVTDFVPCEMWQRGVARTFQRNNLFLGLTVEQNVRLAVQAGYCRRISFLLRPSSFSKVDQEVQQVLESVNLNDQREIMANNLAYGGQRQLELAIALAGRPKLLLLDEPTAGMSPAETQVMIDMLSKLTREVTLIIIEHDMDVVFALADQITVLHQGKVLVEGEPSRIEHDQKVLEVYLGGEMSLE